MYLARLSAFVCVAMTFWQIDIPDAFTKVRTPCAKSPLQQEILDLITPKISKERSACDQNNHKLITPNVDKLVTPKPRHEKDVLHEEDDKRESATEKDNKRKRCAAVSHEENDNKRSRRTEVQRKRRAAQTQEVKDEQNELLRKRRAAKTQEEKDNQKELRRKRHAAKTQEEKDNKNELQRKCRAGASQHDKDKKRERDTELKRKRREAARVAQAERKARQEQEKAHRYSILRSKMSSQRGQDWLDGTKRPLPDSYFHGVSGLDVKPHFA